MFGFGAVFMSTFLGTRVGSARFGNAQAITRCGASATSIAGKDFRPRSHRRAALLRGHGRFTDLDDDE
jgi:hypothetical protein